MRASRITVALVAALTVLGVVLRLSLLGRQPRRRRALDPLDDHRRRPRGRDREGLHATRRSRRRCRSCSSWLTTRVELSTELLRLPSLLAGAATIPLVYAVGARTVGARAALLGTALTALSPFLLFYSTEARSYALMIVLPALLDATRCCARSRTGGRAGGSPSASPRAPRCTATTRASSRSRPSSRGRCGRIRPRAGRRSSRRAAAALAFAPWLPGLRGDMTSATTDILSALQPFTAGLRPHGARALGAGLPVRHRRRRHRRPARRPRPGPARRGGRARARRDWRSACCAERPRIEPGLVLIVALAAAAPVGEALVSAFGSNLFGTRNLAAIVAGDGAVPVGADPRGRAAARRRRRRAGGRRLRDRRLQDAATRLPARRTSTASRRRSSASRGRATWSWTRPRSRPRACPGRSPWRSAARARSSTSGATTCATTRSGSRGWRRRPSRCSSVPASAARGHRMFLVVPADHPLATSTLDALPPGWRPVETRTFPGVEPARAGRRRRSDRDRRVVGRERGAAEEPALDREARIRHRRDPTRSGAGTARRRTARRRARRPGARSARRPPPPRPWPGSARRRASRRGRSRRGRAGAGRCRGRAPGRRSARATATG